METPEKNQIQLELEVPDLSYRGVIDVDSSMLIVELIKQINRTLDYNALIQQIGAMNPKVPEDEIITLLALFYKGNILSEGEQVEKYQLKNNDVIVYKMREKRKGLFSFMKKEHPITRSKSLDISTMEGQILGRQKTYEIRPGNYLWKVECPVSKLLRVVEFDDRTTVEQLVVAIVDKDGYNDYNNWKLIVFVSGVPIVCDKKDTILSYYTNSRQRVVLERRFCTISLIIPEASKKALVTVEAKSTVKSVLEAVLQNLELDGTKMKGYGLFLTNASNSRRRMSLLESPEGQQQSLEYYGLLLDSRRTIGSYRLRRKDILEYRSTKLDFQKQLRKVSDRGQVFVMIELPEQNISKTLQIDNNSTVKDVLLAFFEKNPVSDSHNYALYYEVRSPSKRRSDSYTKLNKDSIESPKETVMIRMEETKYISYFKLRHMDHLILRKDLLTEDMKSMSPARVTQADEPDQNFGVSPEKLEMETDSNGLVVPKVLVQLKRCILLHNGLLNEGIFRAAGSSTGMKHIRELLSNSTFEPENEKDVNTIAAVLKKWFLMLPQKLLGSFRLQEIEAVSGRVGNALKEIEGYLMEPYRSLWLWIIDLAVVTVFYQDSNKMSAINMARLLSPILWEQPDDSLIVSLENTNKIANFLERLILTQLKVYKNEPTQ